MDTGNKDTSVRFMDQSQISTKIDKKEKKEKKKKDDLEKPTFFREEIQMSKTLDIRIFCPPLKKDRTYASRL